MRKLLLLAATAAMALGASQALSQEKKQLVIVVKGLDNPFFEAINQGCQKWNAENASSEYECFYTGPASTSDEAGEAQIVQDMLGKPSTVAMAISPSNAKLIAQTIKTAAPTIPIMTLDADLTVEDAALRKTYLGTDNYLMGKRIGDYMKEAMPKGGKVCSIQGNPGADNILRRAQGWRDSLSGQEGLAELKGEGGWTEVAGCPVGGIDLRRQRPRSVGKNLLDFGFRESDLGGFCGQGRERQQRQGCAGEVEGSAGASSGRHEHGTVTRA